MTCRKRRYSSRGQADRVLQNIRKRGQRAEKKPCRSYFCPFCHSWHLTSDPQ